MDPQVFHQVVAPTLVTNAAFIGITTLEDDQNFVTRLIDRSTKSGKKIFNLIKIALVCEDCKIKGIKELCNHCMGMLPYWQSADRHRDLELMMQDSMDDFMREMRGIQSNELIRRVFPADKLKEMFDPRSFFDTKGDFVSHVFVTVDPAAGGQLSNYAIASCVYSSGDMIVCSSSRTCSSSIWQFT